MQVKNTPSSVFANVNKSLFFVARETGEAMKNDPALALRASATLLQSPVLDGVSDPIKANTMTAIIPVIRTALLATNAVQCYRTFHKPESNWISKGMDGLRVATDMVGVVGAMAMVFTPHYAALGSTLVGASYAADLVSHAYRGIAHVDRRVHVWEAMLNANDHQPSAPGDGGTPPPVSPPKVLLQGA